MNQKTPVLPFVFPPLAELTDHCFALLKVLVAFDTTSRHSNMILINWLTHYLRQQGLAPQLLFNAERNKANCYARIGPDAPDGILLSGHTDVVPVDGQPWNTPPFELTLKEHQLFGRGTSDMKSFIACALAILPHLQPKRMKRPLHLAFSYDEEVGCLGAPALAEMVGKLQNKPALAIIGEPTEMKLIHGHKGIRTFETKVIGHESHSSLPENGVNAINIAMRIVDFLERKSAECRLSAPKDSPFHPPYSSIHVGIIHGGTARNIIPRECSIHWEIRPIPQEDVESFMREFYAFCDQLIAPYREKFADSAVTTVQMSQTPGLLLSETPAALTHVMRLLDTNESRVVSFCTEAGIFHHHGVPAIVCGPGSIEQAHKPNEFIDVAQIKDCLKFLCDLTASLHVSGAY